MDLCGRRDREERERDGREAYVESVEGVGFLSEWEVVSFCAKGRARWRLRSDVVVTERGRESECEVTKVGDREERVSERERERACGRGWV